MSVHTARLKIGLRLGLGLWLGLVLALELRFITRLAVCSHYAMVAQSLWNSLTDFVVKVDLFNILSRLDKYWSNQDIVFDLVGWFF